jgi:hypothetical protein
MFAVLVDLGAPEDEDVFIPGVRVASERSAGGVF